MLFFKPKERTIATIGYPGHGKSIFLAGLFWDSFFALSRTFQDGAQPYSVRALNEEASKLFYGNAKMLHGRALPPANPRSKPEPAILEFKGIPRANSQRRRSIRLVFYDVAGEVFNDDRVTREYAPYVTTAHDLIFLFDPTHPDFSALSAAGANPFAILDAAQLVEKMAEGGMDLTPRALPPLAIDVAPAKADSHSLDGISSELLASLAAPAVDGGERTALLIGDETRTAGVLRGLFAAMATEERLRLTFSTHFYESHHLRSLFALATVRSRAEAPSQRESYAVFDLDGGEFPRISPASAYADWLADCLQSGRWGEIIALNAVLDGLRNGQGEIGKDVLPTGARACAVLWERAGTAVARTLVGEARLVVEFLRQLPSPRALADALLDAAAPSELCGTNASAEDVNDCLPALRSAATGKVWRAWVKRWDGDPMLEPITRNQQQWWKRLWR
ncbi:MAG: hypothetical protein ACREAM_02665 [Blastocatellia bacterium]